MGIHVYLGSFADSITVTYTSSSMPSLSYSCLSVSVTPTASPNSLVLCTLSPGVGRDHTFTLTACSSALGECRSLWKNARFHYPPPFTIYGSLREYGGEWTGGIGLSLLTDQPVRIAVDGSNFGPDPTLV